MIRNDRTFTTLATLGAAAGATSSPRLRPACSSTAAATCAYVDSGAVDVTRRVRTSRAESWPPRHDVRDHSVPAIRPASVRHPGESNAITATVPPAIGHDTTLRRVEFVITEYVGRRQDHPLVNPNHNPRSR